jgi:DNA polymerase III subunit alpha
VIFAETLAEIIKKYPDAISAESIVFLRGRIDRRRETPSIVVSEAIPVSESIGRLTTGIAVKLDQSEHPPDLIRQLQPIFKSHSGNVRVYLQVAVQTQKVVLQLGKECAVRPGKALVDDLEQVLGSGTVQLLGEGSRRQKRLEQQKLFKEEASDAASPAGMPSDDLMAAELDAEKDAAD